MPISNIEQPEILPVDDGLRLRKFDDSFDFAFEWYQDPETVWLVDGVRRPYTRETLANMYHYLDGQGELYFIEALDGGVFRPIGDVCFWQMPESDYPEAKRCYDQMRANVKAGRAEISVRSRENRCCHVRPHARDASDVIPQPHGNPTVKKCFWLNQTYLQEEIAKTLESR